jgi:hypothetical protein
MFAALVLFPALMLAAESRVTVTIAHLVASESFVASRSVVFIEAFAATRIIAMPAVTPVIAIVNVTPESPAAVIPRACADKDAASKPLWPVIPIGRAVVRLVVEVTIWTRRRRPDLDRDLRMYLLRCSSHKNCRGRYKH